MRGIVLYLIVGLMIGVPIGRLLREDLTTSDDAPRTSPLPQSNSSPSPTGDSGLHVRQKPALSAAIEPMTIQELSFEVDRLGLSSSFAVSADAAIGMAALQEKIRSEDIEALAAFIANSSEYAEFDLVHLVMGLLAEKNAQKAWELASSIEAPVRRTMARMGVLSALVNSQPEEAMRLVESIDSYPERSRAKIVFLMGLAEADPARAWAFYQANESEVWQGVGMRILSRWAERDPAAVRSMAAKSGGMPSMYHAVIRGMAGKDPQASWEYALELPYQGVPSSHPVVTAATAWAELSPEEASAAAMALPDKAVRLQAVLGVMQTWASKDLNAAVQHILKLSDPTLKATALAYISRSERSKVPELMSLLVDQMPAGQMYRESLRTMMDRFSQQSPAQAATYLNAFPKGKDYANGAVAIADSWAREGSSIEFMNWLRSLPEGEIRGRAVSRAAEIWAAQNPMAALAKLKDFSSQDYAAAKKAIGTAWGSNDPMAAIQWSAGANSVEEHKQLVSSIISGWGRRAPESASQYWSSLPKEIRDSSLPGLIENWANVDPWSAAQWLRSKSHSATTNEAIAKLVPQLTSSDPDEAIEWAYLISDPALQSRTLETVLTSWMRSDPVKGRDWIGRSRLPNDLKEKLLK